MGIIVIRRTETNQGFLGTCIGPSMTTLKIPYFVIVVPMY